MATVPAAEQTLAILKYLSRQARPVPAATIASSLALPRSTTYHLLSTLAHHGFVVHYPDQRSYGLGLTAYELGSGYTRQEPLQRLARKPMADLSDRCGQGAHLSVLRGTDVVYVIEERAAGRPRLVTDVGVRLPAHSTASGRAMLAALPAQQISALYPNSAALGAAEAAGARTVSALKRLLVDVRRLGYAIESGEVTPGLTSLALPVLDAHRYPIAAVTVTFPESDDNQEARDACLAQIRDTVQTLERRLLG